MKNNLKFVFLIILLSLSLLTVHCITVSLTTAVYGDTHTAVSLSTADVQAAINAASDGDLVIVPAGTATWTSGISLNKGVTLKGSGVWQTVIVDNTDANTSPVTISGTKFTRLTGFTFDGFQIPLGGYSTTVSLADGTKNFRADHCYFRNECMAFRTAGVVEGLIDHCTYYLHPDGVAKTYSASACMVWFDGVYYNPDKWKPNWEKPLALGTSNQLYVEDCLIDQTSDYNSAPLFASIGGGLRIVIRHNVSVNSPMDVAELYGLSGIAYRGISSYEIYKNNFYFGKGLYAFQIGGGTGVIFDNQLTGYLSYNSGRFHVRHWRTGYYGRTHNSNGLYSAYFGPCDGTNPLDRNDPIETGSHTGSSGANVLVCSGKTWTPDQWVGYALRNTSDPKSSSLIVSNTANTITTMMVIKISTAGFASQNCTYNPVGYCADSDVGKQVNISGVGNIGPLNSYSNWYNEKFRLFYVASSSSIPQSGSLSISGGTMYGTYVGVANLGGGNKNCWDNGDNFVITNGYPCMDQVGRGPWQEDKPLYQWNNTYNGSAMNIELMDGDQGAYYQAGRDYYNCTNEADAVSKGMNYTPYTYPHPMQFILGDTVDTSSPAAPGTVYDGASTGSDIAFAYSTTTLSANWTASTDNESGISGYQYGIGTTAGGTNVTGGWIANGSLSVTKTGLSLIIGTTYYFSVKAINGQGLISPAANSNGQVVISTAVPDSTPPSAPGTVRDGAVAGTDESFTYSTATLSANWTASTDNESGITNYQFSIGTTAGATNITNWTALGNVLTVTKTGLTLTVGTTYYFSVKAVNGAGLSGPTANSNGQFVKQVNTGDTTPPSIIAQVRDGNETGIDAGVTYLTDELSANWDASADSESGISRYFYAIGSLPGATDITNWTDNNMLTGITKTGLTLVVGSTYYFSVKSENGVGLQSAASNSNGVCIVASAGQVPPVISNVLAANITATSVTITWDTDKIATSQVEYGLTAVYGDLTVEDTNLAITHSVAIVNLTAGKTYHYRVISKDSNDNQSVSVDFTFTTLSTLNPQPSSSAYPNPVDFSNGQKTTFTFRGNSGGEVSIYTMSGKMVKKLPAQGWSASGGSGTTGSISWDGLNENNEKVAKGVYLYTITEANGDKTTGKIGVMK